MSDIVNQKNNFRYAEEVSIDNEVLVKENGHLKEVKVKAITSFLIQGNNPSNMSMQS